MEPLTAEDPTEVGHITLQSRLGAGGMGQVFLGRTPGGRAVAVKVLHHHLALQPDFRSRLDREVTAAKAVSGAFTAPVVASDVEDSPPWIATAYVPGPTLSQAITENGPLPLDSQWLLAAGLVEALQAIHAEGLLHRDLKPSNILLAADGPRVIDFGIAHAMDSTALTPTNASIGTPGFMSPEQVEGRPLTPASDVFSLGAVLAYAATGAEPFGAGPPLAVLHRVVNSDPRLDAAPEPARTLLHSCLAKPPSARPTTDELLQRITTHWAPPDHSTHPTTWPDAITTLIPTPPPTIPYTQAPTSEPTHDTLTSRYRYALDLAERGKHADAARMLARLATDQARVLGTDDPDTVATRQEHARQVKENERAQAARQRAIRSMPGQARNEKRNWWWHR